MKIKTGLTLLFLMAPLNVFAGDFSNPVPYGSGSQSIGSGSSYTVVPVATAESLRISHLNIGTPNSVVNAYSTTNDLCMNCITIGDNASNVDVTATQDATGACINASTKILNVESQEDIQSCDGVVK